VQNTFTIRKTFLLAAACAAIVFSVSHAAAQNVALLRIESFDAASADMKTLAEAGGETVNPDSLLGMGLGSFGIGDLSIIDRSRPATAALPFEGMMLPQSALVFALPIKNETSAVESLKAAYAGYQFEGGIHTFSNENGPVLYARTLEGYLVFGATLTFVNQFDLDLALVQKAPVPGNISIDVYMEPMVPLINMGLMTAQQEMAAKMQQMQQQQQQQTGNGPGAVDAKSMQAATEAYISAVRQIVSDISRIQASVEAVGGHAALHFRFEGKTGGTLSELASAQKGGLPEISRLVDENAAMVIAGNAVFTPAAKTFMKDLISKYLTAIKTIMNQAAASQGNDQQAAAISEYFDFFLGEPDGLLSRELDCSRGDMAASIDFDGENGVSFLEAFGLSKEQGCGSYLGDIVDKFKNMQAQNQNQVKFLTYEAGPKIDGFSTYSMLIDPSFFDGEAMQQNKEAKEAMEKVWGDKGIEAKIASSDDLMLYVGGKEPEKRLKTLIAAANKKSGRPLDASYFHPLKAGPGFFMKFNIARMVEKFQTMLGEDAKGEKVSPNDVPSSMVMSVLYDDAGGVTFSMATPLDSIKKIASQQAKKKEALQGPALKREPIPPPPTGEGDWQKGH